MGIRRQYTVEFRDDAVALAQRVGISKAARDLGVSHAFAFDFVCAVFTVE